MPQLGTNVSLRRRQPRGFPVGMTTEFVAAAFVLALALGTVLYGALVSKRMHDRRVQARIQESIHLYAVVRSVLAERRQTA
jgi:hypothetical protein